MWLENTFVLSGFATGYLQSSYIYDSKKTYKYAQKISDKFWSPQFITNANRISSKAAVGVSNTVLDQGGYLNNWIGTKL